MTWPLPPPLLLALLLLASCSENPTEAPCALHEWFQDTDGDGYGVEHLVATSCSQPVGHSAVPGDCDDSDPAVHPSGQESCDGRDEDCASAVDEGFPLQVWHEDTDGDGYGNPYATVSYACGQPSGYVSDGSDCDDADATVHPGAVEAICDGVDSDCDGAGTGYAAAVDGQEYETIQRAVEAAGDGATIQVCPGTHREQVRIADGAVLTLTSWSGDAGDTVLDGDHKWTILYAGCNSEVVVSHLGFEHGLAEDWFGEGGGAVGGAIHSQSSNLCVESCDFSENESEMDGGGIWFGRPRNCEDPDVGRRLSVSDSAFSGNHGMVAGGALRVQWERRRLPRWRGSSANVLLSAVGVLPRGLPAPDRGHHRLRV